MSESYSNIKIGHFSVHDAETVVQAQVLEENANLDWESSDANRATRQAAQAIGESASAADFLVARARIVEKMIMAKNPMLKPHAVRFMAPGWLSWVLFVVAFVLGLVTDQFASTESRINLLAFPFFGVLLWNVLVYLCSLISMIFRRRPSDILGLRRFFEFLEDRFISSEKTSSSALRQLAQPFTRHVASRAFHLAALGFVLGVIASVSLRGIGTSYIVGWESTWFAESPEVVYNIIHYTYGALTNFIGPMPNILELANMRFDRLAIHGTDAAASDWLLRMIVMLTIFVVIPRVLMVLYHTIQIARLKRRFPLDIEQRYFSQILRTWRAEAMVLDLLVPMTNNSQATVESAYRLAEAMGFNLSEVKNHVWDLQSEDAPLSLQVVSQSQQVWALMNATTTPEAEVQGAAIEAVRQRIGKTTLVLLVDMAGYMARFGDFSDRVTFRKELWKEFAAQIGVPVVFYHAGVRPDDATCTAMKDATMQY